MSDSLKSSYLAEYDKRGAATCKRCKEKLTKGELRLGKMVPNPFTDKEDAMMKHWFHPQCMFTSFQRARSTTKIIESADDIDGYLLLDQVDKDAILKLIEDHKKSPTKTPKSRHPQKTPVKEKDSAPSTTAHSPVHTPRSRNTATKITTPVRHTFKPSADVETTPPKAANAGTSRPVNHNPHHYSPLVGTPITISRPVQSHSFREFRKLCMALCDEPDQSKKTSLIVDYITDSPDHYNKDLFLVIRLLLPATVKRCYQGLDKDRFIELFSKLFGVKLTDLTDHLDDCGDFAETIRVFFDRNSAIHPAPKSRLTLYDVDDFLKELETAKTSEDQITAFRLFMPRCTSNELKVVIRMIEQDLKIYTTDETIFAALPQDTAAAFKIQFDLEAPYPPNDNKHGGTSKDESELTDNSLYDADTDTEDIPTQADTATKTPASERNNTTGKKPVENKKRHLSRSAVGESPAKVSRSDDIVQLNQTASSTHDQAKDSNKDLTNINNIGKDWTNTMDSIEDLTNPNTSNQFQIYMLSPLSDRQPCKYGASCYQKNPRHREQFSHPFVPKGGIFLNLFNCFRFYMTDAVKSKKLFRYIVAFGGGVVDDLSKALATHFLVPDSSQDISSLTGSNISALCIHESFIWDSIRKKRLQPVYKYAVLDDSKDES